MRYIVNWTANIIIAAGLLCCFWLLLQATTYASFLVPTSSMEPTLLAGDYVLVNKWTVGGRVFNVLDALEGKQVTISRLPGWMKIGRNDVVVFNHPYPDNQRDSLYMDVMLYYVKRCVGLPGDTLEIRNAHYLVHGFDGELGNLRQQQDLDEMLRFEDEETLNALGVRMDGLWGDSVLNWSLREMGPVLIPKQGSTVQMNDETFTLYGKMIAWEQGKQVTIDATGQVLMDGSPLQSYTFTKDYYFMAGDNAPHSIDSRYWGLVPEEYIVGVVSRIWKSVHPRTEKIRWHRIWKSLNAI